MVKKETEVRMSREESRGITMETFMSMMAEMEESRNRRREEYAKKKEEERERRE